MEDIIDSGQTLAYLIEVLKQRGPADIRLCTLLDKPERRVKKQVKVDYTCFTIPDEFVVGYGLDFDQKYRNLPLHRSSRAGGLMSFGMYRVLHHLIEGGRH